MQLRKFHGRTMSGTLARVRRQLGSEALILETHTIKPNSAAARMNPGARYEITAALDPGRPAPRRTVPRGAGKPVLEPEPSAPQPPAGVYPDPQSLLEDLAQLRAQVRQLLEGDGNQPGETASGIDLRDYHELIAMGVDHQLLAPHFRQWLAWRTASPAIRQYIAILGEGPAPVMQGESLREWLWLAWAANQGLPFGGESPSSSAAGDSVDDGPSMLGLVGPTGGGKSTTLAKISSKLRREGCQNNVILTLDTQRFGATEQWRRCAKLIGLDVEEVVSPEDVTVCMEKWGRSDWIGIDTPGGMTPDSEAGRLYGSIVARCPHLETVLVIPSTQQDGVSRHQMQQSAWLPGRRVLFSKLDETNCHGGIVNLTMDGHWKISGFTAGRRIPDDWEPASSKSLWSQVFKPSDPSAAQVARESVGGGVA